MVNPFFADDNVDYPFPSIRTKGRVLVNVGPSVSGGPSSYKHEYEVIYEDDETSIFWIKEGVGWDYWFDAHIDFPTEGGWFIVSGICGHFLPGDGWMIDNDEEWEWDEVRPATESEMASGCLE